MKPILIIRVPKDAVEHITKIRLASYKSFRQFKVSVVYDNDKQQGFKFSVINTSLWQDEIIEKDVLELMPSVDFLQYTVKSKAWRYESNSLLDLIVKVLKARVKNFFYFGKFVD